jgi:predicted nucleic acid-binding protein
MPFVLDASVAVAWAFKDENHANAALALERIRKDEAHVPSLWWYEVRNSLIVNERRRRFREADTAVFLQAISRLDIAIDRLSDEARVLAITRRYRLTVYGRRLSGTGAEGGNPFGHPRHKACARGWHRERAADRRSVHMTWTKLAEGRAGRDAKERRRSPSSMLR